MANIKYLDTALTTFSDCQTRTICDDGSMNISITTILDALKEYEVGIPKEYFECDGAYYGIINWLKNEQEKENIVCVCQNNTCDLVGSVSVDFGFAQYDSLVSDDTFVMVHVHDGCLEPLWYSRYPTMLFKFEKGTSFYNVLDDISFENPDVPSMIIQVGDKHYLVLPRAISESYFVKCIETGEELEPTHEVWFYGSEEDVKKQIISYLGRQRTLSA